MEHTKQGYYKILGPDGVELPNQHLSLDECWETISNDIREGDFTVKCPDRVIGKKSELMA